MSEEEKKAIENYKLFEDAIEQTISKGDRELYIDNLGAALRDTGILLNLIEKQQKEIENSVSKDKIRDKIKEYRTQGRYSYWEEIMALEELLGEEEHEN